MAPIRRPLAKAKSRQVSVDETKRDCAASQKDYSESGIGSAVESCSNGGCLESRNSSSMRLPLRKAGLKPPPPLPKVCPIYQQFISKQQQQQQQQLPVLSPTESGWERALWNPRPCLPDNYVPSSFLSSVVPTESAKREKNTVRSFYLVAVQACLHSLAITQQLSLLVFFRVVVIAVVASEANLEAFQEDSDGGGGSNAPFSRFPFLAFGDWISSSSSSSTWEGWPSVPSLSGVHFGLDSSPSAEPLRPGRLLPLALAVVLAVAFSGGNRVCALFDGSGSAYGLFDGSGAGKRTDAALWKQKQQQQQQQQRVYRPEPRRGRLAKASPETTGSPSKDATSTPGVSPQSTSQLQIMALKEPATTRQPVALGVASVAPTYTLPVSSSSSSSSSWEMRCHCCWQRCTLLPHTLPLLAYLALALAWALFAPSPASLRSAGCSVFGGRWCDPSTVAEAGSSSSSSSSSYPLAWNLPSAPLWLLAFVHLVAYDYSRVSRALATAAAAAGGGDGSGVNGGVQDPVAANGFSHQRDQGVGGRGERSNDGGVPRSSNRGAERKSLGSGEEKNAGALGEVSSKVRPVQGGGREKTRVASGRDGGAPLPSRRRGQCSSVYAAMVWCVLLVVEERANQGLSASDFESRGCASSATPLRNRNYGHDPAGLPHPPPVFSTTDKTKEDDDDDDDKYISADEGCLGYAAGEVEKCRGTTGVPWERARRQGGGDSASDKGGAGQLGKSGGLRGDVTGGAILLVGFALFVLFPAAQVAFAGRSPRLHALVSLLLVAAPLFVLRRLCDEHQQRLLQATSTSAAFTTTPLFRLSEVSSATGIKNVCYSGFAHEATTGAAGTTPLPAEELPTPAITGAAGEVPVLLSISAPPFWIATWAFLFIGSAALVSVLSPIAFAFLERRKQSPTMEWRRRQDHPWEMMIHLPEVN